MPCYRFVLAASVLLSSVAFAQQAPADGIAVQDGPVATLHVSSTLVQIPVLVLTQDHEKVAKTIPADQFSFRIDNKPWFRADGARREGEDPIDLAIFLDARPPAGELLLDAGKVIAELAPSMLHAQDHVSIYVMECRALRAVKDVPANAEKLKAAANLVLSNWMDSAQRKASAGCNPEGHLWDALAAVTIDLSKHTGRRAILALTNGSDEKSKNSATILAALAQAASVAIVGIDPSSSAVSGDPSVPQVFMVPGPASMRETPSFSGTCEQTGGVVLRLAGSTLAQIMQRATEMLRERYIVDFKLPPDAMPGKYALQVRVEKNSYFVRAAGNEVPSSRMGVSGDLSVASRPISSASASPETAMIARVTPPTASQGAITAPGEKSYPAQEKPDPATPIIKATNTAADNAVIGDVPTIQVVTKLTLVDVTVTDKSERPVHGLVKDDFTVKEDGKVQAIRNFDEYGTAIALAQPAMPPLPPGIYTNQPKPAATTSAANVILMDDVSTPIPRQMYAREQALSYLKKVPAGTRVALLELENQLRVMQNFTDNRDVLTGAMDAFMPKRPHEIPMIGRVTVDQICLLMNMRSQRTLEALDQAAGFLAGIKGRKNMVWISSGIPWLTNYAYFTRPGAIPCLQDYTKQLHQTYARLTAARVALYPLDPRGLDPVAGTALNEADSYIMAYALETPEDHEFQQHGSLKDFAAATGGKAYYNRNDLDAAMAEAVVTGADYYSLSYIPPYSKYDDQFHNIDVKVDRPNLRLQYKNGYTAVDLAKLHSAIAEGAAAKANAAAKGKTSAADALPAETSLFRTTGMGHGAATSTELLLAARIVPATAGAAPLPVKGELNPAVKAKALVRYDIAYSIPAGQITVADNADGTHAASVELDVVAYGEDGTKLNVVRQTAKVALQAEQVAGFEKNPFEPHVQMDLPPGKVFVRVGVLDVATGKSGTLEEPQTVAKP